MGTVKKNQSYFKNETIRKHYSELDKLSIRKERKIFHKYDLHVLRLFLEVHDFLVGPEEMQ